MDVTYKVEPRLSTEEFIRVLEQSGLAERRPVGEVERVEKMLREADLIVTARTPEGRLIGVSRALTDFAYCTYLSDLAVAKEFQGRGIGRELIQRTHAAAGTETTLILLAAPAAETYYPHIGMQAHRFCWIIPRNR